MNLPKRIYSFSDAILSAVAMRVLLFGERDLDDLADQGINADSLEEIRVAKGKFDWYGGDQQMMGKLMVATQARDALRKLLLQKLIQTVSKAKFKFGEYSGEYALYGMGSISHDIPAVVIVKSRHVLKIAREQQALLIGDGMTDAFLLELSDLVEAYATAVQNQVNAVAARRAAMIERTKLGNELYRLVNLFADKGKLCWMFSDPARHEDYIIYEHSATTGQTIESLIQAESVVSHELAGVKQGTSITFSNKGTTNLQVFFAPEPTDITGEPVILVLAGGKSIALAGGMGYNEATGKTCFNVFNVGAVEGVYEVVWK